MKSMFIILASVLMANISMAANTVLDGSYAGTGTWSSTGPNGTVGGEMEQSWTQNGEDAHNLGLLKMSGVTVQSFNDDYKFILQAGVNYTMQRSISGSYVQVGSCTQSVSGYACTINQAIPGGNLVVTESGFMQDSNTLVRIGTMTAPDGTVTTYSSTLIRQ